MSKSNEIEKAGVSDMEMTLVIQCFVKTDTVTDLFASLRRCAGIAKLRVIFWFDSAEGHPGEERFTPLVEITKQAVQVLCADYAHLFRSVEMRSNERNQGPCKTCQSALDYAFSTEDYVIFAEDDMIFSSDALLWFYHAKNAAEFIDDKAWAICGESILFDTRRQALPDGWREKMFTCAEEEQLVRFFTEQSFIPSSCFATTSDKWAQFGETRGQVLGDTDLCVRCKNEGKVCIMPIVARGKDVGMLHDNGHSVFFHTKENVAEIKNTYLMSDDFPYNESSYKVDFYNGNVGRLFLRSTMLEEID